MFYLLIKLGRNFDYSNEEIFVNEYNLDNLEM